MEPLRKRVCNWLCIIVARGGAKKTTSRKVLEGGHRLHLEQLPMVADGEQERPQGVALRAPLRRVVHLALSLQPTAARPPPPYTAEAAVDPVVDLVTGLS